MTINGYVAQSEGKNDWMTWNPDEELVAFMCSLLDSEDMLLLGRKTAKDLIPYWDDTAITNPAHPFAKRIAGISKVVFTKTLEKSPWNNTTLSTGSLTAEIASLKNQSGNDILVFGGAGFVSALVKEGLIDEYHLIVNPTAISTGMTIFNSFENVLKFTPTQAKLYPGGKIVLSYQPKYD